MTVDALPPPLVILSACRTGLAEAPPPTVLEGAHDLAPLATELVSLGIPLVLGMAGRSRTRPAVVDQAVRRCPGPGGKPGGGHGRGAPGDGFQGRSADESVDWAFPALFAAGQVDPGFAPVPPGPPRPTQERTGSRTTS